MIRVARELMFGSKRKELLTGGKVWILDKHYCYIYDNKDDPGYIALLQEHKQREKIENAAYRAHVNEIARRKRESDNNEKKVKYIMEREQKKEQKRYEKELLEKRRMVFRKLKKERLSKANDGSKDKANED